jgi:hypothetical protein
MRPARPEHAAVFDEMYEPRRGVCSCASLSFEALTLVVMTMTAPAALL